MRVACRRYANDPRTADVTPCAPVRFAHGTLLAYFASRQLRILRPGRMKIMEQAYKFNFLSTGIRKALASYHESEDFANMVEARIRRESAGWATTVVSEKGTTKQIAQPKAKQKVAFGTTNTLTQGEGRKVAIPSNLCGQLVLLDAAYASLESAGVGYCPGIEAESYLDSALKKAVTEFVPAGS